LLIVCALLGGAALYGKSVFEAPGPLSEDRSFTIERGTSTPDIARGLRQANIISDDRIFLASAYITRNFRRMKAGEYLFAKHASMADVMALIVSGKELVYKLTVPEGWTAAQVIERVSGHENLTGEITESVAEGSILPETYLFRRGMTRNGILKQMRDAQAKLFDAMWDKRSPGLPLNSKEEALVLASIVEKETAIPGERPRIAAVFLNRLRNRMRLQSDPTIIYGITMGKSKLERPILKSDIETVTPYNTYRIAGLPPTPIANPGKESIAAVLNPIDSKELYFVADGTGGHVFAETLEEHRKNVRKWRVVERELAEEAAATESGEAVQSPASAAGVSESVEPPQTNVESEPEPRTEELLIEEAAPAETEDYGTTEVTAVQSDTAQAMQTASPAKEAGLKPGSLVNVSGKLVPIPAQRPHKN
jgi:UPF0755 protein